MSAESNNEVTNDTDAAVATFMETFDTPTDDSGQSADTISEEPIETPVEETPPASANEGEAPAEDELISEEKPADEKKTEFDVNSYFEQSSEGFVKSEEDFKSVIAKAKEHESLQEQIEALKAEKDSIFANETIKTQNRLIKEGKTDEQIAEFLRLSKVDIATLDPKEVLIQREIKNGHTRTIAEKLVDRKYGLDKLSFDEDVMSSEELAENKDELEIINSLIKSDADPVRQEMKKEYELLKDDVSPSEKALKEAAQIKAYKSKLQPFVEKLQADFPKRLVVGDDETSTLSYDVPKEVLESIQGEATEYFMDREVNAESVTEFMTVKKALWLYNSQKQILTDFKGQIESITEKRVRAEFENPQGLPNRGAIPVVKTESIDDDLMQIAKE